MRHIVLNTNKARKEHVTDATLSSAKLKPGPQENVQGGESIAYKGEGRSEVLTGN